MTGEREPWDKTKLIRSLRAAKAPNELIQRIVTHIEKDLYDGMSTSDIYAHAFNLLKREHRPIAAEYSLKKAMLQLGPSGFPFERFVAHILTAQGYNTKVGVMVRGQCVTHEVDVVAEKNDERMLVEAKFHNSAAIRSDVKVALYVHARFQDIEKRFENEDGEGRYTHAWLITNTEFTSQAIQYGRCAGLALTGWNYPKGNTLQDLIQATKMHPLTCLTTLTDKHKLQLLQNGTVLCREVINNPLQLQRIGISKARISSILDEGRALCEIE
ncbi:MAG: ATP-cone domain protein [Parcubacteria group bacterium GW2011_GWA2_47_7]|nr:MAG: ATP-cone domain protein [Parcubacteria group bacterium GW2011_GWA2_47_7]